MWLIRFVTILKNCISNEIENIFARLLIPKTKPVTVEIVYKPPDQTRFSRNTSNQFKHSQYIKQRMTYSRGSEYKLISKWFNIRGKK